MIRNDEQLRQTREAVTSLERSLAILQRDAPQLHPDRYALMAAPILVDLARLRLELDDYLGITEAIRATIPLWLTLRGPDISLDNAPTSVITAMIDTLRRGILAVTESVLEGVAWRPTILRRACEFRLAAWQPGSVRIGLQFPFLPIDVDEVGLAAGVRQSFELYVAGAAWVGSGRGLDELEHVVRDREQRRVVLNQVARLIPRPRAELDSVELSGRAIPQGKIHLRRESRARVREAINLIIREDSIRAEGLIHEIDETHTAASIREPDEKRAAQSITQIEEIRAEGFIREIDLDQRTFTLRDPDANTQIHCVIPAQQIGLMEIAKSGLDRRVSIAGTRHRDSTGGRLPSLRVSEIEVLGSQ